VGTARLLEELRADLARFAGLSERLRLARDVHDLLGLGLSALALKADLIGRLVGRDDNRAAAEIRQMRRLCATARAELRQVTEGQPWLSFENELAAAPQVLASAGIEVRVSLPDRPLPAQVDDVLAPVVREAVTNILRHSAATLCTIEMTDSSAGLRLVIGNDGVDASPLGPTSRAIEVGANSPGRGLANLAERLRASGGRLAASVVGDCRFELVVEVGVPPVAEALTAPASARRRVRSVEETAASP